MRWTLIVLVLVMVLLSLRSHPAPASEPATAGALVKVATTFEHDYQHNVDAPVWDRFDAASRALIPRARYVSWHHSCPTTSSDATVLGATRRADGWWEVDYQISGVTLHDYWHYVAGQWRFSLTRSNPTAAALYSSTYSAFARASGCTTANHG
ncbi:MAG: hypothetical protein KGL23_03310 [Acidobacteriota bacterium]|nr:hypothetical protein [Acidobacteriota bacterium]